MEPFRFVYEILGSTQPTSGITAVDSKKKKSSYWSKMHLSQWWLNVHDYSQLLGNWHIVLWANHWEQKCSVYALIPFLCICI